MGEQIFVSFWDEDETTISGVFCCAQSEEVYPYQGTVHADDKRYGLWYAALPDGLKPIWLQPEPTGQRAG